MLRQTNATGETHEAARGEALVLSNPGYRIALRELYGGAEVFLMRDRRLTQAATVEDTPECRVGFPILLHL